MRVGLAVTVAFLLASLSASAQEPAPKPVAVKEESKAEAKDPQGAATGNADWWARGLAVLGLAWGISWPVYKHFADQRERAREKADCELEKQERLTMKVSTEFSRDKGMGLTARLYNPCSFPISLKAVALCAPGHCEEKDGEEESGPSRIVSPQVGGAAL
jgi:hypothetical protein